MSFDASSMPARSGDIPLLEIDDLLDEVARLARTDASPPTFHLELLERAVRALAGVGGAVWIRSATGTWRTDSQVDHTDARLAESLAQNPAHRELLQAVVEAARGRIILPRAESHAGESPNPTDYLLYVCPMPLNGEVRAAGVLEVAIRAGGTPASQQGGLRVLEALCELAADFHSQRRLRLLQAGAARSQRVDQFVLAAHASLDLAATACTIVNEGRRLIECDRLSVAIRRGRALRLAAVSGLESLDRRANLVRRLEDLTNAVIAAGEPLWFSGHTGQLAPQIAAPLQAWQDESHARSLAIIPLAAGGAESAAAAAGSAGPPEPGIVAGNAALIAERFEEAIADESYREPVLLVARHAGLALQNALEHESLPFYRLMRTVQKARWFIAARRLPGTIAVAVAFLGAVLALTFVPADFEVEGRGVVQPRRRRDVFARADGIVSEVRVEHGQPCREGDVLAVMTRSQLEFESSRVLGEMQTARQRLASVQAARLELTPQTAADRDKYNQLTAEEEEVREMLRSLEAQHAVLKAQRAELVVRSPLTGQVVTWNVRQSLEARPVQRGQLLMQVADLDGPWVLELEVADDRIGHVLEARRALGDNLAVSFLLATDPGTVYRGAIENVALATDVRPPEKAAVRVTVGVDRAAIRGLRPNATVVSRIHCGRRAIGFVWFRGLWETIQKKVLF